ncbi:MAG: hypothetical protein EA350_14575 [Gemmatimonadales bacterium]|nr:MAG: hypothetical protein EA350_14575 [Gemmatimonadales bacterium]
MAELSASLAHEIKNPLASIRSAVEQFTSPRLEDRDRASLTRMVVRESDRLSRLLTDFLDFSRSHVDRMEPVALGEVLRDVLVVIRQHPRMEACSLRVEDRIEDATILASADLLHRALLNLLLNAVQFSPEGALVEVSLERVEYLPQGVEVDLPVLLRIRDHGPGIPPEGLERIFDPFYTTRDGGSGLGLAVAYRMVQSHGGYVLVENPEGGGAEFRIYLPSLPSRVAGTRTPMSDTPMSEPEEAVP